MVTLNVTHHAFPSPTLTHVPNGNPCLNALGLGPCLSCMSDCVQFLRYLGLLCTAIIVPLFVLSIYPLAWFKYSKFVFCCLIWSFILTSRPTLWFWYCDPLTLSWLLQMSVNLFLLPWPLLVQPILVSVISLGPCTHWQVKLSWNLSGTSEVSNGQHNGSFCLWKSCLLTHNLAFHFAMPLNVALHTTFLVSFHFYLTNDNVAMPFDGFGPPFHLVILHQFFSGPPLCHLPLHGFQDLYCLLTLFLFVCPDTPKISCPTTIPCGGAPCPPSTLSSPINGLTAMPSDWLSCEYHDTCLPSCLWHCNLFYSLGRPRHTQSVVVHDYPLWWMATLVPPLLVPQMCQLDDPLVMLWCMTCITFC